MPETETKMEGKVKPGESGKGKKTTFGWLRKAPEGYERL